MASDSSRRGAQQDHIDCPYCGNRARFRGKRFRCDACEVAWEPHDLSARNELVDKILKRAEEKEDVDAQMVKRLRELGML